MFTIEKNRETKLNKYATQMWLNGIFAVFMIILFFCSYGWEYPNPAWYEKIWNFICWVLRYCMFLTSAIACVFCVYKKYYAYKKYKDMTEDEWLIDVQRREMELQQRMKIGGKVATSLATGLIRGMIGF